MSDIKLTYCPLCRGIVVVHLGLPPGGHLDFTNRCQNGALTGMAGIGNTHQYKRPQSWRFPQRSSTQPCGFPVTNQWGWPFESALPGDEWKEVVRNNFDPAILRSLTLGESS